MPFRTSQTLGTKSRIRGQHRCKNRPGTRNAGLRQGSDRPSTHEGRRQTHACRDVDEPRRHPPSSCSRHRCRCQPRSPRPTQRNGSEQIPPGAQAHRQEARRGASGRRRAWSIRRPRFLQRRDRFGRRSSRCSGSWDGRAWCWWGRHGRIRRDCGWGGRRCSGQTFAVGVDGLVSTGYGCGRYPMEDMYSPVDRPASNNGKPYLSWQTEGIDSSFG